MKVVQLAENSKYTPLKDVSIGGIIVMRYGPTDQPEDLVEPVSGTLSFAANPAGFNQFQYEH